MKKITSVLIAFLLALTGTACVGCKKQDGPKDTLTLQEESGAVTMQNDAIRIAFNRSNGSIREVYNKRSKMYLVQDNEDAEAVTIRVKGQTQMLDTSPEEGGFRYAVERDTDDEKALRFTWNFAEGATVTATAALHAGSDEVVFRTEVRGMQGDVYAVHYPIIDNIGALTDDGENDYLVSPFATGYLFRNPSENFMRYGQDLSGQSALTPSGFGSTMQFFGYYTEDKGGFYMQTKDGGNSVKEFVFRNDGGTLQAEIGHFVSDMSLDRESFDYDTVLSNLYEGNWYEAAERYKAWAVEQSWVKEHGLNKDRTDLNKDVYENSVLANFIVPAKKDQSAYALKLYETVRENITTEGSRILTIPFYYSIPQEVGPDDDIEAYFETWRDEALYDALAENGEPIAQFEYTDLQLERKMASLPEYIRDARMKTEFGGYQNIMFAENWQYICASNERWVNLVTSRQREQFDKLGMQGLYNDLGVCAVHPLNCYDSTHEHGTRVNVLEDYLYLLERSHDISRDYTVDEAGNCGFTGQEMITENVLPYVDVYQTRAGAGEMGGMENDMIMNLVRNDVAEKIPLFEYVYHEYSGVRMDGFTLPLASVGVPYYYTMAFTALNGGIPEFNYECIARESLDGLAEEMDVGMIRFVDTLGKARIGYGKDYLVYGSMARVPSLGLEKQMYSYETPIVINWSSVGGLRSGEMLLSPVVASAFRSGDKVALFLCNITDQAQDVSFTVDAAELYGMDLASVTALCDGAPVEAPAVSEGKADVQMRLESRKVYMIELQGGGI